MFNILIGLIYVILSVLVALFWKYKGLAWEKGFFWSFVFTPIVGLIIGIFRKNNFTKKL